MVGNGITVLKRSASILKDSLEAKWQENLLVNSWVLYVFCHCSNHTQIQVLYDFKSLDMLLKFQVSTETQTIKAV